MHHYAWWDRCGRIYYWYVGGTGASYGNRELKRRQISELVRANHCTRGANKRLGGISAANIRNSPTSDWKGVRDDMAEVEITNLKKKCESWLIPHRRSGATKTLFLQKFGKKNSLLQDTKRSFELVRGAHGVTRPTFGTLAPPIRSSKIISGVFTLDRPCPTPFARMVT